MCANYKALQEIVSFEMVSLAKKGGELNWLYKTFSKA